MKKTISIILTFAILLICVSAGIGTASATINPYDQDLVYYNTIGYEAPVILYHPEDDASEWLSEPLLSMGYDKAGQEMYYYNFPDDGNYVFYIADAASRTTEGRYLGYSIIARCYQGYLDGSGYNQLSCYTAPGGVPKENTVTFYRMLDFGEPVIYYRPINSDPDAAWQSAVMTVDESNDKYSAYSARTAAYIFDLPFDIYCFYITDGVYRTVNIWSSQSLEVYMRRTKSSFIFDEQTGVCEVDCYAKNVAVDPQYSVHPKGSGEQRYRDRLNAYLNGPDYYGDYNYEELYYHQDANGETDWALIQTDCGELSWTVGFGTIGNRAFRMETLNPFRFGMALYDVKEDTFYDLYKLGDPDRYDGLMSALDNCGAGKLIGDMDKDDELTVIDVTFMQRCDVRMRDYPVDDIATMEGFPLRYYSETYSESYAFFEVYDEITYFSDFNRDGERDIIDATKLQRYLIGIG